MNTLEETSTSEEIRCKNCKCKAHCGITCMECWECNECSCVICDEE